MSWFDYTDRYGESREDFDEVEMIQCEGCGVYISASETRKNDWSDCVCSECEGKMYCAYCGDLVYSDQKDGSDEYCCERCAAKTDQSSLFEELANVLKPAI